jgi:tetratricopeptide (TPR) repeat protein
LVKNYLNKGGPIAVKKSFQSFAMRALPLAFAANLLLVPISHAQMGGGSRTQSKPMQGATDIQQTELHQLTDVQRQPGIKIDPKEQSAYDVFFRLGPADADKKIQLGNAFLEKYPTSIFAEAVDAGLTNAYYAKQDWKDFYATADKALALKPDDVDLLTTVGWVIPHIYNPHADDADKLLDKAESCEKSAIQVMNTMAKPASLTDAQFAAAKAQKAIQAHSALGLVYFRRQDYDNSVKELQQSTANNPSPDQTDLFVLGTDLQNLDRFTEAADVFGRCSQIAGGMQDRCKESADLAKKQAAQPKR